MGKASDDRGPLSQGELVARIAPLFWDRELRESDLVSYPCWILARVLMFGDRVQVAAARRFFGDDLIREVVERRGIDRRTRNYWRFVLGGKAGAPQGTQF